MKPIARFLSLSLLVLAVVGCQSGKKATVPEGASEGGQVYTNDVYVLVDGKEKGVVPLTVRVRRSFGTRMVSLYQRGKEIRTYELASYHTADGLQLQQSYFGSNTSDGPVYDVSTLPTSGENEFVIPYSPYRLTIEDRQFSLVLIVDE